MQDIVTDGTSWVPL